MDNSGLRHAKGEINRRPCVFASALAHGGVVCELAVRPPGTGNRQRTAMLCAQPVARVACAEFDGQLRQKSVFVIRHLAKDSQKTPPTNLLAVHCGGLRGLRDALDPDATAANVADLLRQRHTRFADWQDLPWHIILRTIAAWRPGR